MPRKTRKTPPPSTPITDYSMQGEFDRPKLPTGEYSGIAPADLAGVPETPLVRYGSTPPAPARQAHTATGVLKEDSPKYRAAAPAPAPDLSEEFAARDPDLDPQYIWRGKRRGDLNVLEVKAPIIYQQEKIFPRYLIEDLRRRAARRRIEEYRHEGIASGAGFQETLAGWDQMQEEQEEREAAFYQHHQGWKNRMILGDSLPVMASLAENEQLRGKVQMIYFDPPYGIKFNSNWQPSTKSTNVKDGSSSDITREPEMVKAFRDTWHDGIHSYLGYLRDRLVVARDLLADSGSCFVQIGDANVHKVRAIMEEVFGEENFVSQISYISTSGLGGERLSNATNYVIWFAKNTKQMKWRPLYIPMDFSQETGSYKLVELPTGEKLSQAEFKQKFSRDFSYEDVRNGGCKMMASADLTSANHGRGVAEGGFSRFFYNGKSYTPGSRTFTTHREGMERIARANRIYINQSEGIRYARYHSDFGVTPINNVWTDTGIGSFTASKIYVVQTGIKIVQRCMLMTTDPGDLVLDPTCGSGTTAYVAEQWGRRWITIDTSRVALALARQRLMTAKFPYYLLLDSPEGLQKESEVRGKVVDHPTYGKVSQGFVYERVPHITLKGIANDAEIDLIWDKYAPESERLRKAILESLGNPAHLAPPEEWQIPPTAPSDWPPAAQAAHAAFLDLKRARQAEMDASIARTAETEYLYDRPYEDKKRIRVAGPFTVESLAPVRTLIAREDGEPLDPAKLGRREIDYGNGPDYVKNMLDVLRRSGVKQSRKADRITFTSLIPWAGRHVVAEGWTDPGEDPNAKSKRVAVAIGPEFGSVTRLEMNAAAREAREGGFDLLLMCAFNFEAYVEEGSANAVGMKTLLARMNADLHMTTDLKETGNGNPFIIFGEPDIGVSKTETGEIVIEIRGVDVYDPKKGEVRSDDADAIDCWMLDTDYNEEAFFARQVYFPGKKDVYKAFKTFLKNDIDEEEWESVAKTESRPFRRPDSGLIAVKVINHFGDEVMKIFRV